MRNFYLFILVCFLSFQFFSCKKKTILPPIDVSKYTATDINCNIVGSADSTDWTRDINWTKQDSALMNFAYYDSTFMDTLIGFVRVSPACPNPSTGQFIVGVNTEQACVMKIVCVDEQLQILFYEARTLTGGPIITAYDLRSISSFHKNQNYRMYYAFFTAYGVMYYIGHGDFRIE